MTLKQLQQQCPIIMRSEHLFDNRKQAILAQVEFLKNRTFIFDTLSENEVKVFKLRYGIDNGQPLSCQKVSAIMNISSARVHQIELSTLKKLRQMKRLYLMCNYNDETIDRDKMYKTINNNAILIRLDILSKINNDTLQIINNIKIDDLDIDFGRNEQELNNMKSKLKNNNIITCSDFVIKLKQYDTVNQFVCDTGLTRSVYNALMESIFNLIEHGDIQISQQNANNYQSYISAYKHRKQQISSSKSKQMQQSKIQSQINEQKRQARLRDGVRNPEFLLIEDLDLSTRSYKRLKKAGINTLQDLIDNKDKLTHFIGLGEKSINEIFTVAGDLGFYLQSEDSYKYAY